MRSALLISNSTSHGSGYMDHCESDLVRYLDGIDSILFVPYAHPDRNFYAGKARKRFRTCGIDLSSIHDERDPERSVRDAQAIFVGGGNTFLLLRSLYDDGIVDLIREMVNDGMKYVGTSAGSNVACKGIHTTNDMPIVFPPSFDAIGIVPFLLNPHYIDPDPGSTHKGETRKQRIDQFHEVQDIPVVGLRESAILHLEGDRLSLEGSNGAKLFRKNVEPVEYRIGSDLSFLLGD